MSKNTFRKIAAVTLVVCMLFAVCGVVFAESRMVSYTSTSFLRDSNTKGTVTVYATSSNPSTPYMKTKLTLQEAPLNTNTYTNSNVATKTKTVYEPSIAHVTTFTISNTKEYRVKIQITDNYNGTDYTTTLYEYLQ